MANKVKLIDINELTRLIDKEKNKDIDLSRLYSNSAQVLSWKCEKGHFFEEKVNVMFRRKNKCFYCIGRSIWPGENDLNTLFPDVAKEFDVEKNGITPDRVSPRDTNTFFWTCVYNHPSYTRSVEHRVNRDAGCPYCKGRLAIPGVNDLKTLYPEIAEEFDLDKNKGVAPEDINPFSYSEYWWKCPKGHSYKKKVILRTKFHRPVDCSKCVKAKATSFPEQAIYYYVKKCFPEAVNGYKESFEKGMELDIFIPSYRIGIEYDGIAFHKSDEQYNRERRKYLKCRELGIRLVRVKESEETWNDTADDIFFVGKRMKDLDFSLFLRFMFSKVFMSKMYSFPANNEWEAFYNRKYGFPTDFNVSRDRPEILEYLVDIEHSFGTLHPAQAALWDDEENGNLTPYMFTPGSNLEPVLKCPNCGGKWKAPISGIVSRKVKMCRACSMAENGKKISKRKVAKDGSLAERSQKLFKQWDNEENGDLSPYDIPLNYSDKVAWKCDICGYRWKSSPNSRVRNNTISDCPHCTGRVAMPGVDDFKTLYPKLAEEWDYELNRVLPSEIKPFANKKYYWICIKCGNSYLAYPGNRIKGSGCSDCAHKRVGKKNSKKVGQYDKDGNLINSYDGLHEAARIMGVVPNAIFQAVKNGKTSKDFYWRYI